MRQLVARARASIAAGRNGHGARRVTNVVLVDTNVVSYFFKGHSLAEAYRPHVRGKLAARPFLPPPIMALGSGWLFRQIGNLPLADLELGQRLVHTLERINNND